MAFRLAFAILVASTVCNAARFQRQKPLSRPTSVREVPGRSILQYCPESQPRDLLVIDRIEVRPRTPYLNEEFDVLIWGDFTRPISSNATVDYQINITANTGDFGALNGTFHICDYLEKMHQPPDSVEPEKACPPRKGPVFIDYAAWFADFLVAPGEWSVKFDAKTAEGERIYCLQAQFDLQCPPWHEGPECLRDREPQRGKKEEAIPTRLPSSFYPLGSELRLEH